MEPARPTFWNIPHWGEVLQYVLGTVTVLVFLAGVCWHVRKWRLGRPERGGETFFQQLYNFIKYGLFQWRLSSDPFAIMMHLAIFWGMVVLAIGTALATLDWDVTRLFLGFQFLKGKIYFLFELALDIFGVILIVGLGMAIWRRYLTRPQRLQAPASPTDKWGSLYLLAVLLLIAVTGFVIEGLRLEEGYKAAARIQENAVLAESDQQAESDQIAARNVPAAAWAPVGYALTCLFSPLSSSAIQSLHQAFWWTHALAAFVFIGSIPFTKAFHLFSAPVNIFFAGYSPAADKLAPATASGAKGLNDFTWRQLLQVDACTSCGKCQDVCPGFAAGLTLSPRNILQKLGLQLSRAATRLSGGNGNMPDVHEKISADELWGCCTCRACENTCPVFVEHPRLIIDMRRFLVDQGRVEEGLQGALMNVTRYGNSFGQSARKRSAWTKDLEFTVKDAAKEPVDYLWFVGDYASYDPRAQQVAQIVARLFNLAGLDWGILHEKEQNAGNDMRRVGEEGLFELLREKNLKVLEKAQFRQIITTDPHTYNTLKNEYRAGGNGKGQESAVLQGRPVFHYSEILERLILQKKLRIAKSLDYRATYHDPCYLGRYNGIYDAPRRVLAALGVRLIEMPRNRENSFCCGAGGGRIWMKDLPGAHERPAEIRIKEALELGGVQYFVVACPKDLAMFQDAVKTVRAEDRLKVIDLGELVWQAVEDKIPVEVQP
jgi:Fe-S oxidoreductase/nitrate reductase gamma subunit